MSLAPLMSSAKHDWRTPNSLFVAIEALTGGVFNLDAAADSDNRKCLHWLGLDGRDALTMDWPPYAGRCRAFLNPPYGDALPVFAARAVEQVATFHDLEVWMLVPARVDTRWWNLLMTRAVQVWFMAGRVKFERPDGARDAAPFPTAVIRLRHDGGNPSVTWGWRP